MAFYRFKGTDATNFPLGRVLRLGLDGYRDAIANLQHVKGVLNQMTDADQIAQVFGFNAAEADAAKAELLADIPSLSPAEQQMLDQFG